MRYYCTYFDRHYLLRGLALYRSLKQHAEPFTLWVLCFDDWSFEVLTKLAQHDLRPVALADFECGDSELLAAKQTRSKVEYYFTCTPSLPLYVLKHHPNVDLITYLDADLYFYAAPEPIYSELGDGSILISEHRYPPETSYLTVHGIYNVGLLSFRNDDRGHECLRWWRERCLEWCFDHPEDGKYADQKYLDDWPARFEGVVVLQNKGAGLAPWNWTNYDIKVRSNGIFANGQPLLFFHYHGLKILSSWLYDPVYAGKLYGELPRGLTKALYTGYVRALRSAADWARKSVPEVGFEYTPLGSAYKWRVLISKARRGRLLLTSGLE
jgi:hypothetical protein